MKTIETKVFEYEELGEKAKEKAREWYREGNNESPFLTDYLEDQLIDILANLEITPDTVKVAYSLGYSQGDGAMFYGRVFWKNFTADIKQSGRYSHYNSKTIELTDTVTGEYADESAAETFEGLYLRAAKRLEQLGYAYIEDENSDERVSACLRDAEYTFTASGVRFG